MKIITVKKAQLIFHVNPHVHGPMPPFDSPEMCPVCGHYRGQENFCPNCGSSFTLKAVKQVKAHVREGKPVVSYAQRKRDGEALPIMGRPWEQIKQMQRGTYKPEALRREPGKDYGADPLGDGKFRMVPSGDVVDFEERQRRLRKAFYRHRGRPGQRGGSSAMGAGERETKPQTDKQWDEYMERLSEQEHKQYMDELRPLEDEEEGEVEKAVRGKPHPHAGRPGEQGGSTPSYTYYNHLCKNCGIPLEPDDPEICPACEYLNTHPYEKNQMGSRGETEGFQRRRWEHRQNPGSVGKVKKAEFDGYLAVSPRMSASERYVNSDRLRQLNKNEDERRKEAEEAAKQSLRNRQPQAAWSEQNKMTEQEKIQYEGKYLDRPHGSATPNERAKKAQRGKPHPHGGRPGQVGGSGPGRSQSFADRPLAFSNAAPRQPMKVQNKPKASASYVKHKADQFIASRYSGASVKWVQPLSHVNYPTGATGWSGMIELSKQGYATKKMLVNAESDGSEMMVR